MAVDNPDRVGTGKDEKLPDQHPDHQIGQIHLETHQPDENKVGYDEENWMKEGPEKSENRALVALLHVPADEVGDQFPLQKKFDEDILFFHRSVYFTIGGIP